MSTTFRLSQLRKLHDKGFTFLWLKPKSKAPVSAGWTKAPRQDFDTFKKQYRKGYNVGVITGKASQVGGDVLAVIDLDVKGTKPEHQAQACTKLFELFPEAKAAPCVISGRGNGSAHYYVRLKEAISGNERKAVSPEIVKVRMPSVEPSQREKERLSRKELATGWRLRPAWEISLLCEGRQVVFPGSVHPDSGRHYSWANGLDPDVLEIPLIAVQKAENTASSGGLAPPPSTPVKFTPVDVERLGLRPDQVAMILDGAGVTDRSGAVFALSMAMLQRGVSEADILSIFTDQRYYLGQTAFDHAKTSKREVAARWLQRYTLPRAKAQTIASAFAHEVKEEASAAPEYIKFSAITAVEKALTRVEGLLGERGLSLVFGESNSGKTFFAIWLAYCLASNRAFFGRAVKKCAAIYVAAESPHSVLRRLYAIKISEKISDEIPLAVITRPVSLFNDPKSVAALVETIKKILADFGEKDGVVFIDTLSMIAGDAEQNSATDIGLIVKACKQIECETGTHICLVHHAGKDASKGPRGSSALNAAVDTTIEVENMGWKTAKQRDGDKGARGRFSLKLVSVSDDFGDNEDRVPVLIESEAGFEVAEEKPKLARVPAEAFAVLKGLVKDPAAPVALDDWRAAYRSAFSEKDKRTVWSAFTRALEALSASGHIEKEGKNVRILA